jgi:magnesium chelatase subunit I
LLDRFGLSVEVRTPADIATRVSVVRRRDDFERDPTAFAAYWAKAQAKLRRGIVAARSRLSSVVVPDSALEQAAQLCVRLGTDGLRGELTLIRASRALASLDGDATVADRHLRRMAPLALGHRLRRNPLDESVASTRVQRAIDELFPS